MKFIFSIALVVVTNMVHAIPLGVNLPPTRQTAPILGADSKGSYDRRGIIADHDTINDAAIDLTKIGGGALDHVHHKEIHYQPNDYLPLDKLHPIQTECVEHLRDKAFHPLIDHDPIRMGDFLNMTVVGFCEQPYKVLDWFASKMERCSTKPCRKNKINCGHIFHEWLRYTCPSKLVFPLDITQST